MKDKIKEEVILSRLFPEAVITLESALYYYNYADQKPSKWQIAVDQDGDKDQYQIDDLRVEPFYQEKKFLSIGLVTMMVDNTRIRIFDRERTICEVVKHRQQLGEEVVELAVQRYAKDPDEDSRTLFEYAEVLKLTHKVQNHIGNLL